MGAVGVWFGRCFATGISGYRNCDRRFIPPNTIFLVREGGHCLCSHEFHSPFLSFFLSFLVRGGGHCLCSREFHSPGIQRKFTQYSPNIHPISDGNSPNIHPIFTRYSPFLPYTTCRGAIGISIINSVPSPAAEAQLNFPP